GEDKWSPLDVELAPAIAGTPDTGFGRGFIKFAPKIIEAIQNGNSEIEYAATFDDGLKVQRVLDAARESNRNGQVVKLG
ncbi:MAG TPA: hypothetical protein VK612_00150, partial [Pyrinomonadaceae bacterium]|nr:hypothetical protein [Pyrinomonadaceae bacterium]